MLFSRDEWLLLQDRGFDLWKDTIFPILSKQPSCTIKYQHKVIDFTKNVWQKLGQDYENTYLFLETVKQHQRKNTDSHLIFLTYPIVAVNSILTTLFKELSFSSPWIFNACDLVYEWFISLAYILHACINFSISLFYPVPECGTKRILWTGVSPQEFPSHDRKLSFMWAVQNGYFNASDILYFVPREPTTKQKQYIDQHRITFIKQSRLFRYVGFAQKIRLMFKIWQQFIKDLFYPSSITAVLRTRFTAIALVWSEIIGSYRPEIYITTTSYSWPERPETAILKAHGVKIVIWAYSANSIHYTTNNLDCRDLALERSIVIADEFWVWNEAFKIWLERRQILNLENQPKILIKGPLMCGDINWLSKHPEKVREIIGLPTKGFFIGVFDLPGVNESWQYKYGGGPPLITIDYAEAFYAGIKHLLEEVHEINIIIKLKRELTDKYRIYPKNLIELADKNSNLAKAGRVFIVDVNIDPYLPISASNAVIGIPFTSPVLAAISSNRYGGYYDPMRLVNYPSIYQLRETVIQNYRDLIAAVRSWMNGKAHFDINKVQTILPPLDIKTFQNVKQICK